MPTLLIEATFIASLFVACLTGAVNIIDRAIDRRRPTRTALALRTAPLIGLALALACLNTLMGVRA